MPKLARIPGMRFEAIHIRAKPEDIEATRIKAIRFLCKSDPKNYRAFYNKNGVLQLERMMALSRYFVGWVTLASSLPQRTYRP